MTVTLREVTQEDLPIFFTGQNAKSLLNASIIDLLVDYFHKIRASDSGDPARNILRDTIFPATSPNDANTG